MPGGRRPAVRRRAVGAVALAHVPAVVGARMPVVDLLPRALPDVVDEEARGRCVGVEGDAERVAQAPGERLLAALPAVVARSTLQRPVPRPWNGLSGGMPPVGVMRSTLPSRTFSSRDGVVGAGAAAVAGVVAAAVADADVEEAVRAEVQVAAVVVAGGRGDVVDQHRLAGRATVSRAEGEAARPD